MCAAAWLTLLHMRRLPCCALICACNCCRLAASQVVGYCRTVLLGLYVVLHVATTESQESY